MAITRIITPGVTDDAVTSDKLNDNIISGTTALTSQPADTDEFLVSDAGTLKRIDYSLIKGGGITMADQWRVSANVTLTDPEAYVTSNWERNDNTGYGGIGTGMTESSGVFSFPSTGIYLIEVYGSFYQNSGASNNNGLFPYTTINNSSYNIQTGNLSSGEANYDHNAASSAFLFDVTDTSNCKVKFSQYGENGLLRGSTSQNRTHVTFIRLGDT